MDADRFDDLLRVLSVSPSRRGVGRVLAGLLLGSAVEAQRDVAGIDAKKGKGKGKKKKKRERDDDCGPGNWSGCCLNGKRLPGTADDACESGGFPCDNCTEQGLVCRDQSCGCSVGCPGCCLAGSSCEPGNSIDACGEGGMACKTCANDQVCIRNLRNNNAYACCGNKDAFCGEERVIIGGQVVSVIQHECCFNHRCNEATQKCEPRCKATEVECKHDTSFTCCTPPDRCNAGVCVGPCGAGVAPCGTGHTQRCCPPEEVCCESVGICYTPGRLNCSHTPGHHIKHACDLDEETCCYPPDPDNLGLLFCQIGPVCPDGYTSEPPFECPDS